MVSRVLPRLPSAAGEGVAQERIRPHPAERGLSPASPSEIRTRDTSVAADTKNNNGANILKRNI